MKLFQLSILLGMVLFFLTIFIIAQMKWDGVYNIVMQTFVK